MQMLKFGLLSFFAVILVGCGGNDTAVAPDASAIQTYVEDNPDGVAAQERAEALREADEAAEDEE